MTYTGDTPILGRGSATPAAIDKWMAQMGRALAPQFAPNGQYEPPPADLGALVTTWCQRWPGYEVNADLVAGQMCKESAGYQSYWAREHFNPAGLGVTGVPGAGEHFETPSEGIECQVAHLLSYAVGRGVWVPHDCRAAGMPASYWGSAPTLNGLNGKWATPGTTYGSDIADLANDLVKVATTMAHEMPASVNGLPVRKSFIPLTNRNRPGTAATAEGRRWITVHETANPSRGANAEMHRRYVHAGGGAVPPENDGVSFSFVVDDKEAIWLLPLEEKSWQASDGAQGTGNSSISIETCINSDGDWSQTKENLARLLAYLATEVPGRSLERIAQHYDWARDRKNCPQRLRANGEAQWNEVIARVHEIAGSGSPARPAPPLVLPGSPYGDVPIIAGFRDWCETLGRARFPADVNAGIVSIAGYPLSAEFATSEGSAQEFERLVLKYIRGNAVPFDVVVALRSEGIPPPATTGG